MADLVGLGQSGNKRRINDTLIAREQGPPEQSCSETSNVGGSYLALDQRQAEPSRLFAHRGDLPGPDPLAICLGAQITKRGMMGEQVRDDAHDLVGRGDHR